MNISLITIHIGNNFGSILQAIASYKVLEGMGHKVTIIDYRPDRVTLRNYIKGALSSLPKFVWRTLFLPIYLKNKYIYSSYLKKFCRLSDPIYSYHPFSKRCPHADIYVTGSDQVWNSKHNQGFDNRYFFAGIEGYKIALSASIGRTCLDDKEKDLFYKYLCDYSAISVREDSAVKLLKDIGLNSIQLIDPTLLLNKADWSKYMSIRKIKESYLLLYIPYNISDKQIIIESAKRIAKYKKLKIVTFSWTISNESYADKTIKFANPGDFLSLFFFADYVITNSFHGTAFSINLNKQFWVFQPSAFSTRIISLLNLTGLIDRLHTKELTQSDLCHIDYDKINPILDSERNRSINFIKRALDKCI